MTSQTRKNLTSSLNSINLKIEQVKDEIGNEMVKGNERGVHNLKIQLKRLLGDREGIENSLAR
jgi:hypothetical protein